jgi:hypothetical protein
MREVSSGSGPVCPDPGGVGVTMSGAGDDYSSAASPKGKPRRASGQTDATRRSANRSQIELMYGSHHQQPQNHGQNDVLDPFLVVEEPSMMHAIHGQHSYRPDPTEYIITGPELVLLRVRTPTPWTGS